MTVLLSQLTAAIADDIDDTTGEYGDQILKAVQASQRFCERQTYYFNETRDVTFPTVSARDWYDANDNANIPTLVHIQAVWKEDSNGQRTILTRTTPEEIEYVSDNSASTSEPWNWTYFGRRIRLYPIPSTAIFTIRLQIGPYRLGTLAAPSDTNAWLDEAYDLIKARAKYIVYKDTLKDPALAAEALNDWSTQALALAAETSARNGTGQIRPTDF